LARADECRVKGNCSADVPHRTARWWVAMDVFKEIAEHLSEHDSVDGDWGEIVGDLDHNLAVTQ
jgi:hypothetical protein